MKNIDVEKIMEEIKSEKGARGYTDVPVRFQDVQCITDNCFKDTFDIEELIGCLGQVNLNYDIPYYNPLPDKGIKRLVKRIIRKMIKFLILPMNQKQNMFNAYVTRSLNCIYNFVLSNGAKVGENAYSDYSSFQEIEKFFDFHERNAEKLETKIILLEKKIDELEKQLTKEK